VSGWVMPLDRCHKRIRVFVLEKVKSMTTDVEVYAITISEVSRKWANQLDDLRERWNLSKEIPYKNQWMATNLFRDQIMKLDRQDLLLFKEELLTIHTEIAEKINIIQAKYSAGIRTEKDWYLELKSAFASVNVHIQLVNHALSQSRPPRILPTVFMKTAELCLPPEVFEDIKKKSFDWMDCHPNQKPT
jgi:hypothetical protein